MTTKTHTPESVEKQIETIQARLDTAIQKLADEVFEQHVKPFCIKHSMTYLSGNGIWFFITKNGTDITYRETDDISNGTTLGKIMRMLSVQVDDNGNDLGCWIASYDHRKAGNK